MVLGYLDDLINHYCDPRLRDLHSIWHPCLIIAAYFILIKKIGPWFMENRKPYDVRNAVIIYDAVQVVSNAYLVIGVINVISDMPGSYLCLEVDLRDNEASRSCIKMSEFYYYLKISDLLDTIFFVMKKNWHQVSYLHVYHHSVMVFLSWLGLKFAPGGHSAYFGLANAFIHTFMYAYYLLTAIDPSWKKNITLKKFITQLQLIQFLFVFFIFLPAVRSSCKLTNLIAIPAITQAAYFFYLFATFYYKTYIRTKPDLPEIDEFSQVPLLDGRIVGGTPVNITQLPYQISLQYRGQHICGGTIIHRSYILTAAHCTEGFQTSKFQVRAGSSSISSGGVLSKVCSATKHGLYNKISQENDISILQLCSPLPIKDNIKPVKLPKQGELIKAGLLATVSGWGYISEGSGKTTKSLQQVKVPIVEQQTCRRLYRSTGFITDNMICAGESKGGKDSCQGDSGGPLVLNGSLVGVVSWGYGCARPQFPGVYTKVAKYRNWIKFNSNV